MNEVRGRKLLDRRRRRIVSSACEDSYHTGSSFLITKLNGIKISRLLPGANNNAGELMDT